MVFRQLRTSVLVLFAILSFGTTGYHYVENMTLFESLYMTMITISTVGFSEIQPLSEAGRIITMMVIAASISIGAYSTTVVVRVLIEGELKRSFARRKVEKEIERLKNHTIICGFGRIGRIICKDLREDGMDFVVIDMDPAIASELEKQQYLHLQMDAATEEALLKAGIMQAQSLVTAVRSDANNVFITLTARGIRPDIFILSRTSEIKHEEKLKRAGANRVVSPYYLGARRMAQVLKRPAVVDFIDIATMGNKFGLTMEEARIRPGSLLNGKNLIESRLRKDFGVIIVGIKKPSGEMVFNPMPAETLESGDVLILLGRTEDLIRMQKVL